MPELNGICIKPVKLSGMCVKATRELGLLFKYQGGQDLELFASADGSFNNEQDGRERTGVCFSIGKDNGMFYSKSSRQTYVGLSSIESEVIALSECRKQIVYLRRILAYIGFIPSGPTHVQQDNNSCISIINDSTSGSFDKRRHIDPKLFHSRDEVMRQSIALVKTDSADMCSDLLTKCKTGTPLIHSRNHMLGISYEDAVAIHSNPQVITVNVIMMDVTPPAVSIEPSASTDRESNTSILEDDDDQGTEDDESVQEQEAEEQVEEEEDGDDESIQEIDSQLSYQPSNTPEPDDELQIMYQPSVRRTTPELDTTHANGWYIYRSELEYPPIYPLPITDPHDRNDYERDQRLLHGIYPIMGMHHRYNLDHPYGTQEHVFSRRNHHLPNTHRILAQGPFLGGESPIWQPSRDRTHYSRPPTRSKQ